MITCRRPLAVDDHVHALVGERFAAEVDQDRDFSVDFGPLLDEESFQRAGVEVLAKSEAEFPVDFEEGIDDRRSNLAVQQRLIGSHARMLDDRSERCGIFSMQCRSFRCPAVGVLRPSPFPKNVIG